MRGARLVPSAVEQTSSSAVGSALFLRFSSRRFLLEREFDCM